MDPNLYARAPVDASEQSVYLSVFSSASNDVIIMQGTNTEQQQKQNPVQFVPQQPITNVDGFAITSVEIPYTFVTFEEELDLRISFVVNHLMFCDCDGTQLNSIERALVLPEGTHFYLKDAFDAGPLTSGQRPWAMGIGTPADNMSGLSIYQRPPSSASTLNIAPLGDMGGTLGDPFIFKLARGLHTTATIIQAFSTQWAEYRESQAHVWFALRDATTTPAGSPLIDANLRIAAQALGVWWQKVILELVEFADGTLGLATPPVDSTSNQVSGNIDYINLKSSLTQKFEIPSTRTKNGVAATYTGDTRITVTQSPTGAYSGTIVLNARDLEAGYNLFVSSDLTLNGVSQLSFVYLNTTYILSSASVSFGSLPRRFEAVTACLEPSPLITFVWTSYTGSTPSAHTFTGALPSNTSAFKFVLATDFGRYGGPLIMDISVVDSMAFTIPIINQVSGPDILGIGSAGRNVISMPPSVGTVPNASTMLGRTKPWSYGADAVNHRGTSFMVDSHDAGIASATATWWNEYVMLLVSKGVKGGWLSLQDTVGLTGVTTDRYYWQFGSKHQIPDVRRIFIDSQVLASDVRLYQRDYQLTINSVPITNEIDPFSIIRQENSAGDNIRAFQNMRQIDYIDFRLRAELAVVNGSGQVVTKFIDLDMQQRPWRIELVLYRKSVIIYPWNIPKSLQVGGRQAQGFIKSVAGGRAQIVTQDLGNGVNEARINTQSLFGEEPYGWAS